MNQSTKIPNLTNGVSQQAEVIRYPSQCNEQVNIFASVLKGACKRPPTFHQAFVSMSGATADSFYHEIERDETERYGIVVTPTDLHIYDTIGNVHTKSLPAYLQDDTPKQNIRAVTIADTTFLINRDQTVMLDPATTPVEDPQALLICKIVGHKAVYKVKVYDDPHATIPDFVAEVTLATDPNENDEHYVVVKDQGQVMNNILQQLQTTLVDVERDSEPYSPQLTVVRSTIGSAFSTTYEYKQNGPYVWIRKQNGTEFKIEVECSLDEGLVAYKDSVQTFAELPKRGYSGFKIKINGSPEDSGDDYWVKFVPANNTPGWSEGSWEETVAPGILYRIDPTTMPYALVSTAPGVANFTLDTYDWADRLVGDDESNKEPSFIGEQIQNIAYHRGRLTPVAAENVVLSQSGVPGNFWRTSVVDSLDDDRIDTPVSDTSKMSIIKTAIEFDSKLLLMAPSTQLQLKGGDILTAKTAQLRGASDYAFDPNVEPVKIGETVYWAFPRGNLTGIWQYAPGDSYDRLRAFDASAHVPLYIPKLRRLAGSPTERILFALPDEASNYVYVYQWFDQDGERVQGSWHKWNLGHSVLNVWVVEHQVYFLMDRGWPMALERMDLSDLLTSIRLDRQLNQDDVTVTQVGANVTVTLPANYTDTDLVLVTEEEEIPSYVKTGSDLYFADTTLNGVNFVLGKPYDALIEMSRPYYRDPSDPNTVVPEDFQVRYGLLQFESTGGFSVSVASQGRTTVTTQWSPLTVGWSRIGEAALRESQPWRFPVLSNSRRVSITLFNDTPYPSAWVNLEWEGTNLRRSTKRR